MKEIFSVKSGRRLPGTAGLVILLGFAIRLYSFVFIPLINPDGTFYIQQARALHYGLWDSLTACFHYLSVYPVLIAASCKIFGDWIVSARIVSLFFGTLSLIPMYHLLRRFFDETASALNLLIFALLPCLVYVSQDVMRDPVYWFFSLTGLYFFILGTEGKNNLAIFLGSVSFIMGMWARIEAAMFIFVSIFHLIVTRHEYGKQRLFFFILPILILFSLAVCYISVFRSDMINMLEPRILTMPSDVVSGYRMMRDNLRHLSDQNLEGFSPYFFPVVRNLLWLLALGALSVEIAETLFYVFALIMIAGIMTVRHRIREDSRLIYFSMLSVSALCLLYCQIIYNWVMTDRFALLFIFPAFVFIGYGLEKMTAFTQKQLKCSPLISHAIVCFLILALLAPKTLRANYLKDKLVFREIGEFVSQREGNEKEILVAGFFKSVRLIHFYANLKYPGAPCFDADAVLRTDGKGQPLFIRENHPNYFLSDEKNGGRAAAEQILSGMTFFKIKEWQTPVLGHLTLYKIFKE